MKYGLLLTAVVAGGVILTVTRLRDNVDDGPPTPVTEYTWDEIQAIGRMSKVLEGRVRSHQRFHVRLEAAKSGLWDKTTLLVEAADSVHEAARSDNPIFLEILSSNLPNVPVRQRVALVLLRHLQASLPDRTDPEVSRAVLHCLCCELRSWSGLSPVVLEALAAVESGRS